MLVSIATPASAAAGTANVSLAWDPSPDTNVIGYNIYYGAASETYTNKVTLGNVTQATVSGLFPGVTYYFAATAFNQENLESEFSNEAVYTVPAPTNAPPTLNPVPDLVLAENSLAQKVQLSGITSGTSTEIQVLNVTAVSNNPELVPDPEVTYLSPSTSGELILEPVPYMVGSASITVRVHDGGLINNFVERHFTVTVTPLNRAPTLNPIPNITLQENSAPHVIQLSGISSGASTEFQTLQVRTVSSNPALIPNPTVTYTSPSTTGTLTLSPTAGVSGTAVITVSVDDAQPVNGIVQQQFSVTVTPLNRPPTLDPIANISLPENSGSHSIQLSGITSGASTESQTLDVRAVSSNPSVLPTPLVTYSSPSTAGTLILSPVAGASGTATVTVLVDDGQLANNIVQRQFTVTIIPLNRPPTLDQIADLFIAGPATVSLTGITSGLPSENQTLRVSAVSSNPGLIPNPPVSYSSPATSGSLTISVAPDAVGTAIITVSVDDGEPINNLVQRQFTVTVALGNSAPTLAPLPDVVLLENSGTHTIQLSGISSGSPTEAQNLTIRAISSNPNLVPNPSVIYESPAAEGTISFAPVPNSVGNASITVEVNDGQSYNNLSRRTFVVSIQRVLADVTFSPTAVPVSQTASVPVNLLTSQGTKEITVYFEVPSGYFTGAKLQDVAPEVGVSSVSLGTIAGSRMQFKARANNFLIGDKLLANLALTAAAGKPSAFVNVKIIMISAKMADGSQLSKNVEYSARIAVVGEQPLLEYKPKLDGSRALVLYGKPSATYAIEHSLGLDAPWTRLPIQVPLSSAETELNHLSPSGAMGFYRAVQIQ